MHAGCICVFELIFFTLLATKCGDDFLGMYLIFMISNSKPEACSKNGGDQDNCSGLQGCPILVAPNRLTIDVILATTSNNYYSPRSVQIRVAVFIMYAYSMAAFVT